MMKDDLEKFITKNREKFDMDAPPLHVLGRILEQMQPQKKIRPTGLLISFRAIRWAAACIIVGILTTVLLLQQKPEDRVPAFTKTKTSVVKPSPVAIIESETKPSKSALDGVDLDLELRKEAILAKVKTDDAAPHQPIRLARLSDMNSPASRITAATAAERLPNQGNDVVDALVGSLSSDPNSNVRLAALDGLARFYQEDYVRRQLVKALKKQHDPVVQIAMINLLVRMRASGVLEQLDRMVNDDDTNRAVKDCAYSGLLELKSI